MNHDGVVDVKDLALASKDKEKPPKTTKTTQYTATKSAVTESSSTVISVEPNITTASYLGKNFTVDINITDAEPTWAWQFRLNWNASVLNITGITEGTFLGQGGSTYLVNDTNYDEGWVLVGNTLLEPASPVNGNGILATINFTAFDTVPDLGDSTLHLNETILLLSDGETEYNHITEDGYFVVFIGDCDGDGDVDMFDFGDFAQAYATGIGDPKYNNNCDFDNDGDVDMFDFGDFAQAYARTL